MKKASKIILMLAIALIVTVIAGTSASASNYGAQADALNQLGLFHGTDKGYELDQPSTRAQAAVMLVRMLGKEAEVTAGSYSDPFTDVPTWAENYIGYMYENGLTNGTSATTFGSDEACSAQMYTAFLLRALGYSEENGDFTYSSAQEFAGEIGLTLPSYSDAFLRDDMAALSYSALFQNRKDGDTILLGLLVSENAVDAAAAEEYLDSFNVYQSYLADCAEAGQSTSVRVSSVSNINVTMGEETQDISESMDISFVLNEDQTFMMKQTAVLDDGSTESETTTYYSDGWFYIEMADMKYKYAYPFDFAAIAEQTGTRPPAEPFYLIGSIEKSETAAGVSYTMDYSVSAMNEILGSIFSQLSMTSLGLDIHYNALEITVFFDAGGNLKSTTVTGGISMVMTSEDQEIAADMTIHSVSEILATGNAVTVTLPADLDTYEELDITWS